MCWWWFGGEKGDKPERRDIPPNTCRRQPKQARDQLVEGIGNVDDQIAISYLEGHDIGVHELKTAIRRATLANLLVAGALRLRPEEQGRPARCSTRSSITCRARSTSRR